MVDAAMDGIAVFVKKTLGVNEVIALLSNPPSDCPEAPLQHPKASQVIIVRSVDPSTKGIEILVLTIISVLCLYIKGTSTQIKATGTCLFFSL